MKNYTVLNSWKSKQYREFSQSAGFVLPTIPSYEELEKMSKVRPARTRRNGVVIERPLVDIDLQPKSSFLNKFFTINRTA